MRFFNRHAHIAQLEETVQRTCSDIDLAVKQIADLRIANERLRGLLYLTLHLVACRSDTELVTLIRRALEDGDDQFT